MVYEVDLQAPALDDFGAFPELLLISGRSPATVKNYLSAAKLLFQEWQVPNVVRDLSSSAWTLTLRAIAYYAGPQPGRPHQAGSCLRHRPIPSSPTGGPCVWFPGLPQDLQPRSPHSTVVRPSQALFLGRRQALQTRPPPGPKVDEDPADSARGHHHPSGGFTGQPHLPSSHLGALPSYAVETKQPRSCSPLLQWWGRSSQPPPSEPCSIEQQIQQVCLINGTPLTAFGEGELLSVFRPASHWNTSRSMAPGLHMRSIVTYCSIRLSRHP